MVTMGLFSRRKKKKETASINKKNYAKAFLAAIAMDDDDLWLKVYKDWANNGNRDANFFYIATIFICYSKDGSNYKELARQAFSTAEGKSADDPDVRDLCRSMAKDALDDL